MARKPWYKQTTRWCALGMALGAIADVLVGPGVGSAVAKITTILFGAGGAMQMRKAIENTKPGR
jgi:hypothetical protein